MKILCSSFYSESVCEIVFSVYLREVFGIPKCTLAR